MVSSLTRDTYSFLASHHFAVTSGRIGGLILALLLLLLVEKEVTRAVVRSLPPTTRRARDQRQPLLLALAVACLYRFLAFTPLPTIDFTNHLVLVGAPMLLATVLALRHLHGPGVRAVGEALHPSKPLWQLLVAVSGIPLSFVAYQLLKPGFVVTFSGSGQRHAAAVAGVVIALVVFSGFGE